MLFQVDRHMIMKKVTHMEQTSNTQVDKERASRQTGTEAHRQRDRQTDRQTGKRVENVFGS